MTHATGGLATDCLTAARDMAGKIGTHSADIELDRALPAAVTDALRDAGLFRIGLPAHLGGVRLPFPDIAAVVEEVAYADTATGWCLAIGNTNAFLAWLEPDAARELTRGGAVLAGSTAPVGTADPTGTGSAVRLTGRWSFCSGVPHADLVMAGYRERGAAGPPVDARVAFVPAPSATVHDTWDTMGLRGTASHDVSLAGVEVPLSHTVSLQGPAPHGAELHRLSALNILMVLLAGVPLGAARRALEETAALAAAKRRPGSSSPLLDEAETLTALLRAEAAVGAARAFTHEVLGRTWDVLAAGDTPSPELRARVAAAVGHALETCRAAATTALRLAGTSALRTDHPLQRCVRDLHAAGQHFAFSDDMAQRHARTRFGLPQPFSLFQV
ncbi:acyl-CoA dehydrogenase family protein [Streptomyces sp. NPDC003036]|uniref:acyl-CoA dehydrogenase family protein n=1 Tax=Streptomyces sp. NPDC003036 TaxID=3154442 RepID=UPI0033BC4649